ncbi:hypothetical protein [Amycolatopsis aidingensis]|uniref:hypothetical protein n=1 Tax=Amycolatopsis aidingensis TaxID=2842453 RepID=UPI001C0D2D10|nr:hypothetical protein [Amycolatopsis aidingensis]
MPALAGDRALPGWPDWPAHLEQVREKSAKLARDRARADKPPKPKPLAVNPSGLPIEEIMSRLAKVLAQQPGAIARRGESVGAVARAQHPNLLVSGAGATGLLSSGPCDVVWNAEHCKMQGQHRRNGFGCSSS